MPTENVHFFPHEFLYRNWHYPAGWYFYDEEQDLYGPFLDKPHAERGLKIYLQQLMDGVAPTQTYLPTLQPKSKSEPN